MNSKPVHMLSTFESKLTTCTRSSRDQNGVYRQLQLPQPDVIRLYNKGMGGIDGVDQKLEAYRTNLKTKAWPPKVIFHGIQLAQVNAHIIYKQIDAKSENYRLLDFSLTLIDELVSRKNDIHDGEASNDFHDNASDHSVLVMKSSSPIGPESELHHQRKASSSILIGYWRTIQKNRKWSFSWACWPSY